MDELQRLCDGSLTNLLPALTLWETLPLQACVSHRAEGLLAMAALGQVLNGDSAASQVLWSMAVRILLANVQLDNRLILSNNTALVWLVLQSMGAVTSSEETWRLTRSANGFLYAAAEKNWGRSSTTDHKEGWSADGQSSLVLASLLTDTVRSLHFGDLPLASTSFKHAALSSPYESIGHLQSLIVFGGPSIPWLPYSKYNALVTLLIILNLIITWAREDRTIIAQLLKQRQSTGLSSSSVTSDPLMAQSTNVRIRIHRALERWQEMYLGCAPSELRAFFHFCRMYCLYPELDQLSILVSYRQRRNSSNGSSLTSPPMANVNDATPTAEACHHAWAVFDEIADCNRVCPLWFPVITYLAGLVVAQGVKTQGSLRLRGSLRVTTIFQVALAQMCWFCCDDMAKSLAEASRSTESV